MNGRVLVVAGSDSGGGAGIQADIKTITALDAYAMTAITALTAQNTLGVQDVMPIPPDFVVRQMRCVLDDIGADAVKTGMLGDVATIDAVCGVLEALDTRLPVVVDPVMVAKGGHALMPTRAIDHFKARMLPLAALLTPNLPEAEALLGCAPITDVAGMRDAAALLLAAGLPAVLVKGGHLPGDIVVDLLATDAGMMEFAAPRIVTRHTHGTGCTLASAIAAGLAQGMDLIAAVTRARAYVRTAIAAAPGFGGGHGPLNHAVTFDPMRLLE